MRTDITPGQTSDYLGFDLVMDDNLQEPRVLLADRGYDADRIRKMMNERGILPQIPMRKTRKMRVGVDHGLYRLRNMVERCFNKLKNACGFLRGAAGRSVPGVHNGALSLHPKMPYDGNAGCDDRADMFYRS